MGTLMLVVEPSGTDFDELFGREYPRLLATMFLACGDRAEAEDVAQTAIVRALERREILWGTRMNDLRSRLQDAASGVELTADPLGRIRVRVRRRRMGRRIATIAVAVLVAAAGTLAAIRALEPTGRRRPAGRPPNGMLVFLRTDRRQVSFGHDTYIHADPRIVTEDLTTGSLREVPVSARQIRAPLVSPDGTKIALSVGTLERDASWETDVVNTDN